MVTGFVFNLVIDICWTLHNQYWHYILDLIWYKNIQTQHGLTLLKHVTLFCCHFMKTNKTEM